MSFEIQKYFTTFYNVIQWSVIWENNDRLMDKALKSIITKTKSQTNLKEVKTAVSESGLFL